VDDEEAVERGTREDPALTRRFELTGADGSDQSWPLVLRGKAAASKSGRSAGARPACEEPKAASRSWLEVESVDDVVATAGNRAGRMGD
jgi:hypothetical protein